MKNIEKLIGYEVNKTPLPAYIAENHPEVFVPHHSSAKSGRGGFKNRYNRKVKGSGSGRKEN